MLPFMSFVIEEAYAPTVDKGYSVNVGEEEANTAIGITKIIAAVSRYARIATGCLAFGCPTK